MRILILAGVLVAVAACGGSSHSNSDRVLHLRTGDYTEAQLRAEVRAQGLPDALCAQLKGLSASDVRDILDVQWEHDFETATAGGVIEKQAIQTPNPDDDLRQAAIFLEECERLAS